MVDLDPEALYAKRFRHRRIERAQCQNLILPAGAAKIRRPRISGPAEQQPDAFIEGLNNLPMKSGERRRRYTCDDVAQVRDGYAVQTNMVRDERRRGRRSDDCAEQRSGFDARHRGRQSKGAAAILAGCPRPSKSNQLFDQSVFVRAAISGVLREALIAAVLTGLMILLFLGSWRSTLIVCISIPLVDSDVADRALSCWARPST